eukprot:TRINITY_DN398_c0_g3_i2.p1 TRINITY_DN398_c0_g3~~TRINITY_DN398_c0_g3_i2.p1  ORF type:complete len:173 (+),score=15.10 TRINITY_DN398_c0_g3_i2:509-1027(+)
MATQRHATLQSEFAEQGYVGPGKVHKYVDMKVQQEVSVRRRTRIEMGAWLLACAVVLWYGDGRRHFLEAVLYDPRLRQRPFYISCLCVAINTLIFCYLAIWVRHIRQDNRDFNLVAPGAIPTATMLGLLSYGLYVYSMWPIWGWATILILYILFMGFVVLSPYLPPYTKKEE